MPFVPFVFFVVIDMNEHAQNELERMRAILFGAEAERYEQLLAEQQQAITALHAELQQAREQLAELQTTHTQRLSILEAQLQQIATTLQHVLEHQNVPATSMHRFAHFVSTGFRDFVLKLPSKNHMYANRRRSRTTT